MTDITTVWKDEVLTKMAKRIFGADIVESCYIRTWRFGEDKYGYLDQVPESLFTEDTNNIDMDGRWIVINFKNGKSVCFANTEWGSISSIDMQKDVRIM